MIEQLFRFGIVGLLASAIYFCVVVLLVQTLHVSPLIANFFGFVLGFQMSYWGHRLWTFTGTTALHRTAAPKLIFIQILNFLANEYFFYVLLKIHVPYQLALFLILSIFPIFTFTASKLWVFR